MRTVKYRPAQGKDSPLPPRKCENYPMEMKGSGISQDGVALARHPGSFICTSTKSRALMFLRGKSTLGQICFYHVVIELEKLETTTDIDILNDFGFQQD